LHGPSIKVHVLIDVCVRERKKEKEKEKRYQQGISTSSSYLPEGCVGDLSGQWIFLP
jgi:hypothetical protein